MRQAAIPTPTVLMCKARAVKKERRKCWVEGELVGPDNVVYATAQCLYIETKPKPESKA